MYPIFKISPPRDRLTAALVESILSFRYLQKEISLEQKPKTLKRLYGGAATAEYYWPRPEITDPIVDALRSGESVSLFGLRRTGKSSALLEVQRVLRGEGKTVRYVDVQGKNRVDPIVASLVAALPTEHAGHKVTSALSGPRINKAIDLWNRIRGRESPGPLSPVATLHQVELIKGDLGALLAAQNRSIILIVDELPYLIVNMLDSGISIADVNSFLATLRAWRHEGKVPMLLAGSMGLQWLIRERGIARENFNDLVPYTTPSPLSDDEARAMVHALAVGNECEWMSDPIVEAIVAESAAKYPSFLQFAFGRIKGHGARTVPDVVRIFEEVIRPSLDEDFYDQFDTRLARYATAEKQAARDVLRRIDKEFPNPVSLGAVDDLLASHDAAVRDHLFLSLTEDGFVRDDTKVRTMAFSSPLVHTR